MKSKGVTPVVAVVLLMGIAVAATTTAYQFISNAHEQVQTGMEDEFTQEQLERRTNLNIEAVYEGNDGDAFMTIRNTGDIPHLIQDNEQKYWHLYVDDAPSDGTGTNWDYVGNQDGSQLRLSAGSTINIDTNVEFPPEGGEKKFEMIGRYESSDTYFCENTGGSSC